jgi:hypothetical protein
MLSSIYRQNGFEINNPILKKIVSFIDGPLLVALLAAALFSGRADHRHLWSILTLTDCSEAIGSRHINTDGPFLN